MLLQKDLCHTMLIALAPRTHAYQKALTVRPVSKHSVRVSDEPKELKIVLGTKVFRKIDPPPDFNQLHLNLWPSRAQRWIPPVSIPYGVRVIERAFTHSMMLQPSPKVALARNALM